MQNTTPIAIVGIGCLFPKADGVGAYWANVRNAVDCIGDVPPTHWNPADYFDPDPKAPDMTYARRGGFLSAVDFNPLEFGIPPHDLEATDTTQLLGLVAAKMALRDAGVSFDAGQLDRSRVSVILGVTGTLELVVPLGARLGHPKWKRAMAAAGIPAALAADAAARIAESYVPWQENSFPGLLGNVVAGRIANKLDLHGTNCVVDAACASSLSAIHLAAMELQTGRADVVVSGGADTFNDIFMFMCFSKTPALSPSGNAKPFDAAGDGTILGEGLGLVVLKRLADAERDGDTVYAVLRGVGTSSDGKGTAIYAPSAAGQERCLRAAYAAAGVSPATVELVEAHGTGTKVGDATEATALAAVFGAAAGKPAAPWCAVGSVKSQIGHTKAAAGAASLIKAALALHFKVLPPTMKVTAPVEPLRAADTPFYVNAKPRPWLPRPNHPRRAGVSAFGFGGSNFHCVLEEHTPTKTETDWDGTVEILAVSGATPAAVAELLAAVPSDWTAFARRAAVSRAVFDSTAACRLTLVAHRATTDLPKLLAAAAAKLAAEPAAAAWHTPDGATYGTGPVPGQLAVLFPGQGSQYVGMLRDLSVQFPEMLDALVAADRTTPRLCDAIYPPTSFAPGAADAEAAALKATNVAQPAIGAVAFGAWKVLSDRFGVAADAFAGHSYGELVALAAAGAISPADLIAVSRARGELMAAQPGDAGGMLAVFAPRADVEAAVAAGRWELVLANDNAPAQVVLSGATADLDAAAAAFAARGTKTARLPVAAAFHSPRVAAAAAPFRAALDGIDIAPGRPVYANTTAQPYPSDPTAARDLLGNQLAKPVRFVDLIRNMVAAGVRTVVEVGPGAVVGRLAEATAGGGVMCLSLDASVGRRSGVLDLANILARLAARGYPVRLSAWEAGSRCRPADVAARPGLTVPVCGANVVQPRPSRPPATPTLIASTTLMADPPSGPPTDALAQALRVAADTIAALQRMQEQTAQLHKQFLDSQDVAQRTLAAVVAQQHALFAPGAVAPVAVLPAPVYRPQPVAVAPVRPPVEFRPAPVPVAPRPALAAPSVDGVGGPDVAAVLLAVVAEKTGYPAETLDLSMSLDADLGVDSIKRVEILSAVQERLPAAPIVKPEHLGTMHTLQDVAAFLGGASPPISADVPMAEPVEPTYHSAGRLAAAAAALPLPAGVVDVRALLLAVVAEKTGYPVETLDADMSLDTDLGIDSIKRVEILSALQERLPHAPVVKPEHLGSLHTLRDVAAYLTSGATPAGPSTKKISITPMAESPPLAGSADEAALSILRPAERDAEAAAPPTEHVSAIRAAVVPDSILNPGARSAATPAPRGADARPAPDTIERSILQAVDLDLTTLRPRVPLAEGGEVWLVADAEPLADELAAQIAALGFTPKRLAWTAPDIAPDGGHIAALVLLAPEVAPAGASVSRLGFQWLQAAGPRLRQSARHSSAAAVVSVARLDGAFGLANLAAHADPAAGGLAGLLKTARYEWPELAYKSIDLAPGFAAENPSAASAALVEEILYAGPAEVGVSATHRCTLELARTVRRASTQTVSFGPKDVLLVTGGGRGVTAEAAVALAEAYQLTLVLTGRTPTPVGPEPAWLAGLTAEAALKAAIAANVTDPSPKAVGEFYTRVVAQREIRETLARVEAAGSRVAYFPVNVANGRAVADLLHQVKVKFGPVTGLVHGAGVLADRRIEQLTPEQFDFVYATKVDGLRNLLDLLGGENLKAVVLFSSTTARFGRAGQLAYAAANEVLNKTAQVEARRRPAARVVAVNWGPWEGGMVTPALRRVFESEGVGLIPLADGGTFLVQELNAAGRAVEVVALGGKSRTAASPALSPRSSGPAAALPVPAVAPGTSPPTGELLPAFERVVDVATHPVLKSHVLDGRAVLPMAIHLEWLAHAALHGNPGLVFHGFNDLRITHGVMVEDGAAVTLRLMAGKAAKQDKLYVVPVELRGKRRDRDVIHSRAEVVLAAALPKAPAADRPPSVDPYPHPLDEVYKYYLFHGPDLHGIEAVEGLTDVALVGTTYPAPPPGEWFANPLRSGWVADPLVLDASFQLMILWSLEQHRAGSLPCFAGRYRQYRRSFPAGPVKVVIRVTRDNGSFARADIDYLDADGQLVAQLQDYECVIDAGLNQAFRRNQLGPITAGK